MCRCSVASCLSRKNIYNTINGVHHVRTNIVDALPSLQRPEIIPEFFTRNHPGLSAKVVQASAEWEEAKCSGQLGAFAREYFRISETYHRLAPGSKTVLSNSRVAYAANLQA